jgi:hypothetical protein
MKEEDLKKPLFVYAQDWYKPEICADCSEFNFVLLPEGAAAFCNNVENDKPCFLTNTEDLEMEIQSSARLALEAITIED